MRVSILEHVPYNLVDDIISFEVAKSALKNWIVFYSEKIMSFPEKKEVIQDYDKDWSENWRHSVGRKLKVISISKHLLTIVIGTTTKSR